MPEPRSGYFDAWHEWHDANPPDMGYSGVHEHRPDPTPPNLRPPVPKVISEAFDEPTSTVDGAPPQSVTPPVGPEDRAVRGLMALLRSLLPHEDQEP